MAQLRAELDRRVNENDLRHKETRAVCVGDLGSATSGRVGSTCERK